MSLPEEAGGESRLVLLANLVALFLLLCLAALRARNSSPLPSEPAPGKENGRASVSGGFFRRQRS